MAHTIKSYLHLPEEKGRRWQSSLPQGGICPWPQPSDTQLRSRGECVWAWAWQRQEMYGQNQHQSPFPEEDRVTHGHDRNPFPISLERKDAYRIHHRHKVICVHCRHHAAPMVTTTAAPSSEKESQTWPWSPSLPLPRRRRRYMVSAAATHVLPDERAVAYGYEQQPLPFLNVISGISGCSLC